MRDFFKNVLASAAGIIALAGVFQAAGIGISAGAVASGSLYTLLAVSLYWRLGVSVLAGKRISLQLLLLVALKIILLAGAVAALAVLTPGQFWSAIGGGFCFVPAAVWYAVCEQRRS